MHKSTSRYLTLILIAFSVITLGCQGNVELNEKQVQSTYNDVLQKNGGIDGWTLSYHPMIYAAWVDEGNNRSSGKLEKLLKQGNDTFQTLRSNVNAQAATGAETINRQEFLAIIPDEAVRSETDILMTKEGVPALHAYARAYIQSIIPSNPKLPDQILIQLGRLYKDRPDLLQVPVGEQVEDADSRWRDWLHEALAGCGLSGILTILKFDHFVDGLQKDVEGNFWDGRLSIAYNLRSIQLAKVQALDPILLELAPYRQGGQVTSLHDWMYYNLAFSLHVNGGLFPYSKDDLIKIDQFISEGLMSGPLGEGEEAVTIADAIGRAPNLDEAGRLLGLIDDLNLPCERRQLGYIGLAKMFSTPVESWATDATSQEWLRLRVTETVEKGPQSCGNSGYFGFLEGALTGFTRESGRQVPGSLFSDSELVRIHEAFIGLLPKFTSADDRASALYLLQNGLNQAEFMMRHPELVKYRDIYLKLVDDWSATTTFEGSKLNQEEFQELLVSFRESLGVFYWMEHGENDGESE